MLNLGIIGFAQPWLLLALVGLPVLWFLLRVTPPAPRLQAFPAIRLLMGLKAPEETPARTPWWLLLLRLMVAALIILGLAQPLVNPSNALSGSGPLVLVVDDGWAAARYWSERLTAAERLLAQAEREERQVIVLTTAAAPGGEQPQPSAPLPAGDARSLVQALKPKPWPADRAAAAAALRDLTVEGSAHVVWLSDGLESADSARSPEFARALQRLGRLDVLSDGAGGLSRMILSPESQGLALLPRVQRASGAGEDSAVVLSIGEGGRVIARSELTFAAGETLATSRLELPAELRNRIERMHIEGESTAGAVMLLDERWRRRPVGMVSVSPLDEAQPLLSETYYLARALEPFTELRRGSLKELLQRELAVLILPDGAGTPEAEDVTRLAAWLEEGGLLLRFAGPHLAEAGGSLLPVNLRGGDRILGGAMTWDSPARLAPFHQASPFAGIEVPGEVLVEQQVLAEPSLDLGEKTWARLSDGTPLVTAERRGSGWIVLFHTTANTAWSNLALSGIFVEMLQRVLNVSQGVAAGNAAGGALAPLETLDGFGVLGTPPPQVLALGGEGAEAEDPGVGPQHPPGYYGAKSMRRAHNLGDQGLTLQPIGGLPSGVRLADYASVRESDLKPWLIAAALVLALIDLLISLALRGFSRLPRRRAAAGAALLLAALALPLGDGASAQSDDRRALEATLSTRLAYVSTGVPHVDEISEAGLNGLTLALQRRTSVEAGPPLAVELASDDLSFFPLLYWPITNQQRPLSEIARRKVGDYLKNGGTILFDLREASASQQMFGQMSRGSEALQRLSEGLEIPKLVPVPPDHVLTKSFYLMQVFPGRFAGGTLWVEASEENVNDGVASILVGSNDWAGAWAVDRLGHPINALVPGGAQQREMAYRFGVNLVMYALTGNYKADQVHVPFILERLGQ